MKWTIGKKLFVGFGAVILLLAVAGMFGIREVKIVGHEGDVILDEKVPMADASMEMIISLITARDLMGEYMLSYKLEQLPEIEKEFDQAIVDFDKFKNEISNNATNAEVRKLAGEADELHEAFQEFAHEIMADQKNLLQSTSSELTERSEERRVGKECRSRWSPYH